MTGGCVMLRRGDQPGENRLKYFATAAGNKPEPRRRRTVGYIHSPTELSWLDCFYATQCGGQGQLVE